MAGRVLEDANWLSAPDYTSQFFTLCDVKKHGVLGWLAATMGTLLYLDTCEGLREIAVPRFVEDENCGGGGRLVLYVSSRGNCEPLFGHIIPPKAAERN